METTKRGLYQAEYRTKLEDEDSTTSTPEPSDSSADDGNTSEENLSSEEKVWKKRYADLRSYNTTLTDRVRALETQLQAAQKKEIKIPSSKEELDDFARKYPDVFRHIRSIAMAELLSERENIELETKRVKEDLAKTRRELGLAKILKAHPDFNEINLDDRFHAWLQLQPKQVQDWAYEADDPDLCIKVLDFYKLENPKAKSKTMNSGADKIVNTRGSVDTASNAKKTWKDSEVRTMHPKVFEQFEEEIDNARREGRYEYDLG